MAWDSNDYYHCGGLYPLWSLLLLLLVTLPFICYLLHLFRLSSRHYTSRGSGSYACSMFCLDLIIWALLVFLIVPCSFVSAWFWLAVFLPLLIVLPCLIIASTAYPATIYYSSLRDGREYPYAYPVEGGRRGGDPVVNVVQGGAPVYGGVAPVYGGAAA